jgi:nucleotide-binding universal stress UspA family protein
MFKSVVVGIDDNEAGRDALKLAKQLVRVDGDLLLVYVEVVMPTPGPDTDPTWQLDDRRHALERLASVRDGAHASAQLLTVQAGSVARGLHEAVRRHGDLLVIGASRRDGFERTFVGDDTREVLQGARSAVAVAPSGYAARMTSLDTIGVGYDGSSASEQALTVAREIARTLGAELSAFEVVAEPMYAGDPISGQWALDARVEEAEKQLAQLGDVKSRVAAGDAAAALAHYADSVDLLVVGAHDHRVRDRFSGGSTAQRLAESPACPLLVLAPENPNAARAR